MNQPESQSDQNCLRGLRRSEAGPEAFCALVARYLRFVFCSAFRRLGNEREAIEATRAVFLVLRRRGRKLRLKTVLAVWLFDLTSLACRKLDRRPFWRRWFARKPGTTPPSIGASADDLSWHNVSAGLDRALDAMPHKLRATLLVSVLLDRNIPTASTILRTKERRVVSRQARGLKKLSRRVRKLAGRIEPDALRQLCAARACAEPIPTGLLESLTAVAAERRQPKEKLARRLLRRLAWVRWRRRALVWSTVSILLIAAIGTIAWRIDARTGHSRGIALWIELAIRFEALTVRGLAAKAKPWPASPSAPQPNATSVRSAADLYQTTNIWLAHIKFTPQHWKEFQPERIAPLPHFFPPGGRVLLRNPEAQRSGIAGVLGFDFHWTHADLELSGLTFTNIAARIKGNGTYLASLGGRKQAFKVDLNKFVKGQKLAGADELTFNNLVVDQSFLSDTLAYEYFRDAGVPAPRTAFAYVTRTIGGKETNAPVGLYIMVEAVDESFAASRFGSKKTPIFKPVTYKLFEDLGAEWKHYADIYDLKTEATPAQEERVIAFAQLVSHANDRDFSERVGEFLDLEAFARFLAGQVMLSNYDSILCNGQNFHLYLDPGSNKFGFIPWDMDLSWGSFFLLASTGERERASIWHPWVGKNLFIERVMKVEAFRSIYRAELEHQLATQFIPEKINRRIDELAAVIREPLSAESDYRRRNFEEAIAAEWKEALPKRGLNGEKRPVHQVKRFLVKRAQAVRHQLDGKTQGIVLRR